MEVKVIRAWGARVGLWGGTILALAVGNGVVSTCWGTTARAASSADEVDGIVQAVEAKYADVDAMQADFVQVTHSEVFGDERQIGEVSLKRPAKMRWDFGGDKQFITNGDTMWVYTKPDRQVIRYGNIQASRSSVDSLLASLDRLDELFDVSLLEAGSDSAVSVRLQLVPKQAEPAHRVQLALTKDLLIHQVTITDPYGGVTELEFQNMRLGAAVPDSLFEFQVPEGVEVIQAGG